MFAVEWVFVVWLEGFLFWIFSSFEGGDDESCAGGVLSSYWFVSSSSGRVTIGAYIRSFVRYFVLSFCTYHLVKIKILIKYVVIAKVSIVIGMNLFSISFVSSLFFLVNINFMPIIM